MHTRINQTRTGCTGCGRVVSDSTDHQAGQAHLARRGDNAPGEPSFFFFFFALRGLLAPCVSLLCVHGRRKRLGVDRTAHTMVEYKAVCYVVAQYKLLPGWRTREKRERRRENKRDGHLLIDGERWARRPQHKKLQAIDGHNLILFALFRRLHYVRF